jgi:flagellin
MIVQHNMTALNANRQLGVSNSSLAKSTEKLSSGYRINRAGDDAAGLSISEKMRGQIRGLNQASTNAQDGVSLIQTAEGAIGEVHDILTRMTELAEKSANGTLMNEDRNALQKEMDQLCGEIDRIATTANFNQLKLMDGSMGGENAGLKLQIGETSDNADKLVVKIESFKTADLFGKLYLTFL